MARGINKVILIGNLGADPEARYMPSGTNVTNIRVATTESWKDKDSDKMNERTEWHKVTLYNKLGMVAAQFLHKGSKVYIEGSLHTSKWQDKQGNDRYTTEIVANNMQMLDSKADYNAAEEPDLTVNAITVPATTTDDMDDLPF